MVLLYGRNIDKFTKTVTLNDLNHDQIIYLSDRLKLAHIKLNFTYNHFTTVEEGNEAVKDKYKMGNIDELKKHANTANVKDFIFLIALEDYIYKISFEILYDI